MSEIKMIDVTVLEPRLKHPTVFQAFDNLAAGEAFLLHNDHDPKPLYYQLLGERGNVFTWNYLQSGPSVWEVEIRKHPAGEHKVTLGELAAKDLAKAAIFKKYGLDFCCGGKKTLAEACREKGLIESAILAELEQPVPKMQEDTPTLNYQSWPVTFLADYIVNVHHSYVRNQIKPLRDLAESVTNHHGKSQPELYTIRDLVGEIISELTAHMKKEELVLFPYVRQIEESHNKGMKVQGGFASVQSPISMMEQEHELVSNLFREIESLTNDYKLPADSCNSYALFYKSLKSFYNDLVLHIHLENNILFPKAIALEQAMR